VTKPPTGPFPLPRPPGRCRAPDKGLQPGRREARARRGLHGVDHPEELALGKGVRREVLLWGAAGRAREAAVVPELVPDAHSSAETRTPLYSRSPSPSPPGVTEASETREPANGPWWVSA